MSFFLPFLPLWFLPFLLSPLFSLEISFSSFFLTHVQLFFPCLLKHYALSNHLSLFLCQNSAARILVILFLISLWHSLNLSVFQFIPCFSDFHSVRSITANHQILFYSSSLWATQESSALLCGVNSWCWYSEKISCYNFAWDYLNLEICLRRTGILLTLNVPSHGFRKKNLQFFSTRSFRVHQPCWMF